MKEDIIIQISEKIRSIRKEKGITLQELANKADVSKGLISQIENSRTVPSLLVLINIIKSLNVDLNDFFKDIQHQSNPGKVIIKRSADYTPFEKEQAKGFIYKRILSQNLRSTPIDIVLLELKPGTKRMHLVKTDAYEYKYIIKGSVQYVVNNEKYILLEGDSLFFDGRQEHTLSNDTATDALMLVIYFFSPSEKQ